MGKEVFLSRDRAGRSTLRRGRKRTRGNQRALEVLAVTAREDPVVKADKVVEVVLSKVDRVRGEVRTLDEDRVVEEEPEADEEALTPVLPLPQKHKPRCPAQNWNRHPRISHIA